jgi:hypothetical protein
MMIWGTPVSALQFFGYSIALGGLVYYKLGADKLKEYFGHAGRSWQEFGVQRPALRKLVIFGLIVITLLILMGGLGTGVVTRTEAKGATSSIRKLKEWVGGVGTGTGGR